METIVLPQYEYLSMKQQIAELQEKNFLLQDRIFIDKFNRFIDLSYKEQRYKKREFVSLPFKFGAGKGLIQIADNFNDPIEEFNDYL